MSKSKTARVFNKTYFINTVSAVAVLYTYVYDKITYKFVEYVTLSLLSPGI